MSVGHVYNPVYIKLFDCVIEKGRASKLIKHIVFEIA